MFGDYYGVPSSTDKAVTVAAAQRYQQDVNSNNINGLPEQNYLVDVPICESDVERWSTLLKSVAPPAAAPDAAFTGSGFLSAQAVLAMDSDEQRRAAVHKLAPFPQFNIASVAALPMTKALKIRREKLSHRQRFPLQQERTSFLDAVLNHCVVAVVGSPGSGRTLQAPIILSETDIFKRRRIVLVAVSDLSARLVARRLREERGEDADSRTVAVLLPSEREATEGTSIIVTTADVLLRQLLCDPLLLDVGCVIIDDAHLRSESMELCCSLLRERISQHAGYEKKEGNAMASSSVKKLHVVLNCLEEAVATPFIDFFNTQSACRATSFSLNESMSASSSVVPPPTVMYLEETVQWLTKCRAEGSTLCTDLENDLMQYVENVDAVTSIMAANDAEFADEAQCRSYWCPIIVQCIQHYDAVNRASTTAAALPPVVVVAPNLFSAKVIEDEVLTHFQKLSEVGNEEEEKANRSSNNVVCSILLECVSSTSAATAIVEGHNIQDVTKQRHIIIIIGDSAQALLPPKLEVGLVIDCARVSTKSLDLHAMADRWTTEYAATNTLRHRRSLAKHTPDSKVTVASLIIQLIPQSVRLSAQHRRFSADVTQQHPVFRLPFERYVQLYQILQATEEAAMCLQSAHPAIATTGNNNEGGAAPTVSSKIAQLFAANFIGMSAVTSARYEQIRRAMAAVESFAVASGHIDMPVGDAMARLKPLGVLTTCLPLPLAATRALVMSSLWRCPVEATAIVAMWMVGDLYDASAAMLSRSGSESSELRAMFKEARLFFARESTSDMVASFNVYRMWLSMRLAGAEDEEAFLDECRMPKVLLEAVAEVQKNVADLMQRHKLYPAMDANILESVVKLPDDAIMGGRIQGCLTAGLYPNCTVPTSDGSCVLMDGVHAITSNRGVTATTRRLGIFSDCSVATDDTALDRIVGRPFVFCSKAVAAISTGSSGRVSVLTGAVPLMEGASVVFCGEGHERPKQPPHRCRGWSSILTGAWRHTRRARQLPPPSQLPPVSIQLQPYDTIGARSVVLSTDHNFNYTMRQTTSRWLLQLRDAMQQHLRAAAGSKEWQGSEASSKELTSAWEWWRRRRADGHNWLREERHVLAATANSASPSDEETAAQKAQQKSKLYSYYEFLTVPGKPPKVVVQAEKSTIGGSAAASSPHHANEEDAQPNVYRGKMPSADVEQTIQMCVKSVASRRSRDSEAQLLKDNPDMFSFLDPENPFHEYYLYLLRIAAPDLEMLGDNLEELIAFLEQMEEDLRAEMGYVKPDPRVAAADAAAAAQQKFQEVGVSEEDAYAQGGLQVEAAAVNLKKASTPIFAAPPTSVGDVTALPYDPTAAISTAPPLQVDANSASALPLPNAAAGNTLLEKLLAMKAGGGAPPVSANAAAPSLLPGGLGIPGMMSTTPPPPPPTAEDLLSAIQGVVPDVSQAPSSSIMNAPPVARATAEELMALLAPPPPPAEAHVNPLSKPPPPLPAKAMESLPPSVVVYPLPEVRYGNVLLSLAKALGETLGMKVGPTFIVGRVARIDVPNHKVEARALDIKTFTCMGQKINIFKNDRITDNPDYPISTRGRRHPKGGPMAAAGGPPPRMGFNAAAEGVHAMDGPPPQSIFDRPEVQIGVLDSDEDGSDGSSEASSVE